MSKNNDLFTIKIQQTLNLDRIYEIEAKTEEEATEIAKERWYKEDFNSDKYRHPLELETLRIESEFDPYSPKLMQNQEMISFVNLTQDVKFNRLIYTPYDPKWKLAWSATKKSQLIESFLINFPVNPIVFYKLGEKHWQVIYGMEVLQTIVDFVSDRFTLTGLAVIKNLNGRTYSTLERPYLDVLDKRRLKIIELIPVKHWDRQETEKLIALAYKNLRQQQQW